MLRWTLPSALLLALILAAWPAAVDADEPPTVHEITSELMCQCGCAMTVAACQESMECSIADSMVADIQQRIDAGESKKDILNGFAAIYGEEVLAAPLKSGFSLAAWVTPLVVVAAGAVVGGALVWAWVRRRAAPLGAAVSPSPSDVLRFYEERVDEDLRSWSEDHR